MFSTPSSRPDQLQGLGPEARDPGQLDESRRVLLPEGVELGDASRGLELEDLVGSRRTDALDRGQTGLVQAIEFTGMTLDPM